MPRPRKGVTLENLHHVDRYFSQSLKNNRLFINNSAAKSNLHYDALDAFKKLPAIDWKNDDLKQSTLSKRCIALQEWIDQYVSPTKWQRCLLTLRQNKSRKKLKLRRLDLQLDVYLTIKALAKKQKISLGEVIYKLAKPALDKIYKSELAYEQGTVHKKLRSK